MDEYSQHLSDVLTEVYRNLLRVEEQAIKKSKLNLSISEMHLIEAVGRGREKGRTVSEIAEDLSITLPSVTVAINKLMKRGYVEKNRCGKDGRVVFVHLTREGRRIDRFHRYYHYKMVQEVSGSLTPKERDALYNGVLKLNRFFHESIDGKTDENHPKAFTGKEGQQA